MLSLVHYAAVVSLSLYKRVTRLMEISVCTLERVCAEKTGSALHTKARQERNYMSGGMNWQESRLSRTRVVCLLFSFFVRACDLFDSREWASNNKQESQRREQEVYIIENKRGKTRRAG